jgi:hypothetical protein
MFQDVPLGEEEEECKMRAKSVQPKFTGVPKMVIFDSGCGQSACRKTVLGWAIHRPRVLRASIPYTELQKVPKVGKSTPKKGSKLTQMFKNAPKMSKRPPIK